MWVRGRPRLGRETADEVDPKICCVQSICFTFSLTTSPARKPQPWPSADLEAATRAAAGAQSTASIIWFEFCQLQHVVLPNYGFPGTSRISFNFRGFAVGDVD
jgi:hypothetical protein